MEKIKRCTYNALVEFAVARYFVTARRLKGLAACSLPFTGVLAAVDVYNLACYECAELKDDLQTQLFYRHNRGITLTSSGQILVFYAEKILHVVQEARSAVGSSAVPSGPLQIGAMETIAAGQLPKLLTKFHTDYSAVDISLNTGATDQLLHSVLHYDLSGVFVVGPVEHPELVQEYVVDEEVVLVTP
ncbi:LysR substrate-binding domain-containing protein [Paenibacillus sp. R14(2021)]|uniref:LysR substrate-binding domain-containing protein n=1 Tax=Paenibacillus sp. R14(2021) TaxID=2859228 RepID=UPI001C615C91|nr:LysR substrate-binding domain-containing protein [Paenibacillus sp. R14(2021)]